MKKSTQFSIALVCLLGLGATPSVSATNIYIQYGTSSYCKVSVTAGTDIVSDALGGTYPIGNGLFTSAGDQFVQGSLDAASCGTSVTQSSPPIFATYTASPLTASPTTLQGTSNSTSLSWSVQNATQCTASATFTPTSGSASPVTLSGWNGSVCSNATSCTNTHSASLSGLNTGTDGTYALTLTCSNTGNGPVSSTANVSVTHISQGSCNTPVVPSGLTQQTSVPISIGTYPNAVNQYTGNTSDFGSVFGRQTVSGSTDFQVASGETAWPGVSGVVLFPVINANSYLAVQFTPATAHTGKWYATTNAGQVMVSISISQCPGDFRITASPPVLGQYCSKSGYNASSLTMYWTTDPNQTGAICHLNQNQQYFFNVIQAPLTDSTSRPTSFCASTSCSTSVTNNITQ